MWRFLLLLSSAVSVQAATIAVDVGHYLAAPGATSAYGSSEFSYNLALARRVESTLQTAGHKVLLINADGQMRDLRARVQAAAAADLLISIHHDSVQPQYLQTWDVAGKSQRYADQFSGYSLFVHSQASQFSRSFACAQAVSQSLLAQDFKPTNHHAPGIAGEDRLQLDPKLGIYDADFVVVRLGKIPAILFEAGVIVNRADALALQEPATQNHMAEAIAKGLSCLK
ncbi:N-acetylmuramoyl-L-alanine amidase family protein [Iodobacter fluviatilis]|uniref:N-acetylmuramoyl-L-alanine amidase n=1 Tax=Iodobacter fluviatilis TaxID=537 RepID=A0A377SYF5_9NEIS|nr:N-acetylmuramoyl-L-alanine amidase [Iodobacter fluviatilis]TCU81165.1 N-acetylmuramoyl-L-alanine amidase [Iodobacter fluviatilis]STR45997.1 N-acetylmuramoyl-L-alanine amidase AmiC precursor [Iodobacter fluviatilis]